MGWVGSIALVWAFAVVGYLIGDFWWDSGTLGAAIGSGLGVAVRILIAAGMDAVGSVFEVIGEVFGSLCD